MHMHAITAKAQGMVLSALEEAAARTGLERLAALRHRIEHMGLEDHDPDYLNRAARLGVIPVPTAYFMNMGPGTLVAPRTRRSFLYRTMLDMGFCVPGNSDTAGAVKEALDPMYQIWCMVNRLAIDGAPVCPEEGISVREAIETYTDHSAFASLEEGFKGILAPGYAADLCVLDRDPFSVPSMELREIKNVLTVAGGRIVYREF